MKNTKLFKTITVATACAACTFAGSTFKVFQTKPAFGSSVGSSPGPVDANIFVNLSKKLVPSVVNISTVTTVKGGGGGAPNGYGSPDDLFRRFFEDFFRRGGQGGLGGRGGQGQGPQGGDEEDDSAPAPGPHGGGGSGGAPDKNLPRAMSLGTGFIIDASGLILTNNHVVADADEIKIQFTEEENEKATDGEVVGRDPELDLALIKVKTKKSLVPVVLGDSDQLEVGEYVIAIGNPFGQGHSVTHGIVSAKERRIPDLPLSNYLQTDAPINPGNSGGPLVNLKGEVIGINNAIDARAHGIGFAIPISSVKKVLPQLRSKGTVARGYIGVLVNEMSSDIAGKLGVDRDLKAPFVTHVYPGEPADKAGMKPYDIILEFNKKPIHSSADLITEVTSVPVNDSVPVKIKRGGDEKTLTIKVAQRPGAQQLAKKETKKKEKRPARVDTGMELEDLTPESARELGVPEKTGGAVVISTAYGSPADRAGLMRGDIILEVDRKAVKNVDDFYSVVKAKKSYLLRVRRADPQGREAFSVVVLDLK